MVWPFRRGEIETMVTRSVDDYLASDKFADALRPAIERVVISIIRNSPDVGLTRVGFIMKIAVTLYDAARTMPWSWAVKQASDVYQEFRRDNQRDGKMPRFGDPDWDWSGAGARTLAHEYAIDYWD
jgi:hypothetical protein